jgi:hypothetical protein
MTLFLYISSFIIVFITSVYILHVSKTKDELIAKYIYLLDEIEEYWMSIDELNAKPYSTLLEHFMIRLRRHYLRKRLLYLYIKIRTVISHLIACSEIDDIQGYINALNAKIEMEDNIKKNLEKGHHELMQSVYNAIEQSLTVICAIVYGYIIYNIYLIL